MNRMTSKYAFVAVVAGLMLGVSALVQAHTKLMKTEPAADSTVATAPTQVSLTFNEAPDLAVTKVEMTGSEKVKLGKASMKDKALVANVEGQMTDGVYKVLWATAGEDGHPQKGEFSFTLKRK